MASGSGNSCPSPCGKWGFLLYERTDRLRSATTVVIARVLVQNPTAILADEPTLTQNVVGDYAAVIPAEQEFRQNSVTAFMPLNMPAVITSVSSACVKGVFCLMYQQCHQQWLKLYKIND